MQWVLYLGMSACSLTITYTGVRYGRGTRGAFSLAMFSCVTCTIASFFFLAMTGFCPSFNVPTLVYSLLFAAVCLISQYSGIAIYRHADVAGSGMVRSGASLLLKCAVGVWLFHEIVTDITLFRIVCMLMVSVAVFMQNRHIKTVKTTWRGWLLSLVMVVNGVASTVVSKYYAVDTRVVDSSSYFLLVNLICLVVSAAVVLFIQRGNMHCCVAELRTIRPKQYAYIVANTVASNVTSLLTVAILAEGDILLFTPLSGAISILTTQIVAVLFEKEKFMPIPVLLPTF